MARPLGISILGGLVILAAVILILISIASFVVGLAFVLPFRETGTTLLLNGLLYFAIGVVLGVAGSGLLRMRAGVGARHPRHAGHPGVRRLHRVPAVDRGRAAESPCHPDARDRRRDSGVPAQRLARLPSARGYVTGPLRTP